MMHTSKYLAVTVVAVLVVGAYFICVRTTLRSDLSFADKKIAEVPVDRYENRKGLGGGRGEGSNMTSRENCIADECLVDGVLTYPAGTLSDSARNALDRAYTDEYHAHELYGAVIAEQGSVRPFIMIIRSEEKHLSSLVALYDKYGITPPTLPPTKLTVPTTLATACTAGVTAEKLNIALYEEELLPVVTGYPDITSVFTQLMQASQERHLPAFIRCAGGV